MEEAPVRVRLVFADRHLSTDLRRSESLRRSWVLLRPELATVAAFSHDITCRFGLSCPSARGLLLSMDGFIIPPFESTSIFRDNDKIRVEGSICKKKKNKKKTVAIQFGAPQIQANKLVNKGTAPSSNGIMFLENGENASHNEEGPLSEQTSSKRKQKELETPTNSKKKKLKLVANERPVIINESNKNAPAVEITSQLYIVNQQTTAPVVASERNEQVASIGKSTSTGFRGGANEKFHGRAAVSKDQKSMMLHKFKKQIIENSHGAALGNGTHKSPRSHLMPGQTRFISPGAGPSNWQANWPRKPFQGDGNMTRRTPWNPRSELNGLNTPNESSNWEPWNHNNGQNTRNPQLRVSSTSATEEASEEIISEGEKSDEDKLSFESLFPLTRLPREGDIIAYRLDIIDSLGCPGFSSFRVGEVVVFDPLLMLIFLRIVREYPIPDSEMSELEKSMYQEDGSIEVDFESLVDLRLIKESKVKKAPKMYKSGKGKNNTGNSLALLGENDNNANSAWEVGEASNVKEANKNCWGAWARRTSRAGAFWPSMGQGGTGFGSHSDFSSGRNGIGENNTTNLAWKANDEVENANEGTHDQQNGWDTWAPSTSRTGASRPHVQQNGSGFGSCGSLL